MIRKSIDRQQNLKKYNDVFKNRKILLRIVEYCHKRYNL